MQGFVGRWRDRILDRRPQTTRHRTGSGHWRPGRAVHTQLHHWPMQARSPSLPQEGSSSSDGAATAMAWCSGTTPRVEQWATAAASGLGAPSERQVRVTTMTALVSFFVAFASGGFFSTFVFLDGSVREWDSDSHSLGEYGRIGTWAMGRRYLYRGYIL
jgi:hypothetical protein